MKRFFGVGRRESNPRDIQMLLNESEVRRSLKRAQASFPRFADWKHNNEINESYCGFALWGAFVPEPNAAVRRRFFITFDTYEATWRGHLTIGQHCSFWSSADVGDAQLLDTGPCETLEDAIAAFKVQVAGLFAAFSSSPAEPGTAPESDGV
jgi:hypothetical protein